MAAPPAPFLAAAPALNVPDVAGTPVVLTEEAVDNATVACSAMYVYRLKRMRLEGIPVTDNQLALAVINEHKAASTGGQGAILNSINNLAQAVNNLTQAVNNLTQTVKNLEQTVNKQTETGRAMEYNSRKRTFNSRQTDPDGSIRALQKVMPGGPNPIGAIPQMQGAGGVFPNTRREMLHLTISSINQLAAFYQEDFGNSQADSINVRRGLFADFVGTPLI